MNANSFLFPLLVVVASPLATAQTLVFATDFDGALPAAVQPGAAMLEGVQGYATLGPSGAPFGGNMLRSPTGNVVTLQLTNLPPHNAISLDFLFAAIDSLDGTGTYPSGDFFKITLDGNPIFRESFANALASQVQSYVPPPGVELARRVDLGFTQGFYYLDSAYWLGNDPQFARIGHTAATATFTFEMEGPGIQPLYDESWGMDRLHVTVDSVTHPGSATAYGTGCGPTLAATAPPRIGQTLPLLMQNLPASSVLAFLAIGDSATQFGALPLPLALDGYGAPGCWLLHDLRYNGSSPMLLLGTSAVADIAIPGQAIYAGFVFRLQGWAIAPGSNTVGVVFSNGLQVQVGQ